LQAKNWPERADWQKGPHFGSPYSFMGIPATRDLSVADVAVVGLPFDGATNYRPGARFGPRGIRYASGVLLRYSDEPGERQPPYSRLRVVDYGDVHIDAVYVEETLDRTQKAIGEILDAGVHPVCMGGDHSLSLALARACARKYGPISLLLLDAHPEYWNTPPERPYTHGSWLRIAVEEGVVDPKRCIQVGIRGPNSLSIIDRVLAQDITVITLDEARRLGVDAVLSRISEVVTSPLYVTLDIDCIDPAYAPATGVPEVGGFTSQEILALVRGLKGLPAVCFDVMEVAPVYDHAEITSLLAATLIYEYLMSRL
jgi:agmatinase/guanidinopropionase